MFKKYLVSLMVCCASVWAVDLSIENVDTETGTALPVKMRLLPWMPLAKEDAIPVVADWVISIMEPVDKLKEMYQKVLDRYHEQRKSQDSSSDESTEDTESD